ncbi:MULTISPECIES: AMP-dependent synthetase/ligase [Corynebacterium]|uniref:AMP-dependent synthetase/ligase n=1 Tax=Corynebacterium TaxID=1716 RepID=UPI00124D915A|nr:MULTISPECIES: long-chain fatty acid--CoA ligase [Corynebacterium]
MVNEYSTPAKYSIGEHDTCLSAMLETARSRPYGIMFTRPQNFEWVNVTGQEFAEEVYAVAKGLIANGVQKGDRVALLCETRYEWTLIDFAIWAAGAVSVPIYGSSSLSQVQWIIEDSGAVFAFTESQEHTALMRNLLVDENGVPRLSGSASKLRRILEINASAVDTIMFEGREVEDAAVEERIAETRSEDLASLVYTSGTTGRPKGCMLTHHNWLAEAYALLTHPIGQVAAPGNRVLTFLPLAHVFSRAVSLAVVISGATQSHWSDFSTLPVEFQRSRPHLILGVPRVFEKVRNGAALNAKQAGPIKDAIFEKAEKTAREYSKALDTEEGPSKTLQWRHATYDKLVYSKLRAALGNSVRYCISGGAAMDRDLLHFYRGIGVTVYEGYGLTELTAAAAVNFDDNIIGTVGRPVGGVSARLSSEGEVMFKGQTLFRGYWNNEEANRESFDEDGWFNTGDLGEIYESGHIEITGRKKDLIVTAGGKNISPGPLEDQLRSHPLISQALVVGDGKPFVGVLITLEPEAFEHFKAQRNIPLSKSVKDVALDPMLRAEIQDAINSANMMVSHAEAIKKFYILDRDLKEEENELTPTLKVKRNVVVRRFSEEIDVLYRTN